MNDLAGKKVLVVGLGVSGEAAAMALLEQSAHVTVVDDASDDAVSERARRLLAAGAAVETGGHTSASQAHDLAVVSPGIPPAAPVLQELSGTGVAMWSEIELAYRLASCDFLAVTGTNGKTTTTSLIADMLREGGVASVAGGNIGLPLTWAVKQIPAGGAVAVEASSFQLAGISVFRPRIAVVLNVAEDHTDWHGSFDQYVEAKARIFENQTPDDVLVLNADDDVVRSYQLRAPSRIVWFSARRRIEGGLWASADALMWRDEPFCDRAAIQLRGLAGLEDALAAAGAALEYGVGADAVERALTSFRFGRHRMELVAVLDGVEYVDDSKATNPHATLAAVEGRDDVVLIAGGRAKGIDLSVLAGAAPSLRGVVAIGEAADDVVDAFKDLVPVRRAGSMKEAVAIARREAIAGGSVLLSPACASLDMYSGYAERGADFARRVKELAQEDPVREHP